MTTPRERLTRELDVRAQFERDARQAYDRALALTSPTKDHKVTAKEFQALDKAYQHLLACRAGVQQAIAQIEAYDRRARDELSRQMREKALRKTLTQQYGDLGPQYNLIVDRLIAVVLQAESLEANPHIFDPEEHSKLVYQTKALVDQLQKHTETTKTEALISKRVEQQAYRIVEIIERVVLPQSPVLWQSVVQTLESEMPRLDVPALAAAN